MSTTDAFRDGFTAGYEEAVAKLVEGRDRPTRLCMDTPFGTYHNQVTMVPPERLKIRGPVGIDVCLASEIATLWALEIRTVASCCGHGEELGIISVATKDIERMRRLGYHSVGSGSFRPRSLCTGTMAHIIHEACAPPEPDRARARPQAPTSRPGREL